MQSKSGPFTLFKAILLVQNDSLIVKGYDETLLNSFDSPGRLRRQLEEAFLNAVIQNLMEFKLAQFSIDTHGYFVRDGSGDRKKYKVSFEFTYVYNPQKLALTVTSLKATLNDEVEKEYKIERHPNVDLPPSQKVFHDLYQLKTNMRKDQEQGTVRSQRSRRI